MSWAAAAAGISIASTLFGVGAGLKAEKDAKKAVQRQADLTYQTRLEEMRRTGRDQEQVIGYNRAAIGASNIQFSGSAAQYLKGIQSEFARDLAWQRNAAAKEREAILAGAPGSSSSFANIASGVSSISNTIMNYYRPTGG